MLQDSISNPLPKVEGTWFVKHRDGWKELEAPAATHPITPPEELVQQWLELSPALAIAAAFQAGADQELEACCGVLDYLNDGYWSKELRAARRPKPPSLKERALEELNKVDMLWDTTEFSQETLNSLDTIRRALEQLDD
jgi:hypothetical protein